MEFNCRWQDNFLVSGQALGESEWKFSDGLGVFFHPFRILVPSQGIEEKEMTLSRFFVSENRTWASMNFLLLLVASIPFLAFPGALNLHFFFEVQATSCLYTDLSFGKSFPSICTLFLNFFPLTGINPTDAPKAQIFNFLFDFGFE